LLNALLKKANSSPQHSDHCAELCVLLLSRPLPESIPLPASAQPFFLRAFERATQTPDVKRLKPVYSMLNGACRNMLSQVPTETREQFEEELYKILSSPNTAQVSILVLWCFGIVTLAENHGEAGHLQGSDLTFGRPGPNNVGSRQGRTKSGRRLFGTAEKLHKTMFLTSMSVVLALKGEVPDEDAMEGIRIAVRMVQSLDRAALQAWPRSSAKAMDMFLKLPEKIGLANRRPAIQLEAMSFYAIIAGEGNIRSEVVTQYERCVGEVAGVVDADYLGESLSTCLPLFMVSMVSHSETKLSN
jgi:hypothetical protein